MSSVLFVIWGRAVFGYSISGLFTFVCKLEVGRGGGTVGQQAKIKISTRKKYILLKKLDTFRF